MRINYIFNTKTIHVIALYTSILNPHAITPPTTTTIAAAAAAATAAATCMLNYFSPNKI